MKRKIVHYYDECWQQSFWFMESCPKEIAFKLLKKAWPKLLDGEFSFHQGKVLYRIDGTGPIVIWTTPQRETANRAAILAHECVHAAHICLDRAGMKADFNNDEAVTYLVTVLMRKALERGGYNKRP